MEYMKRFFLIAGIAVMYGCISKKEYLSTEDCPPRACTMEFRTVGVAFQDSAGRPVDVEGFAVTLKKNGKELPSAKDRENGDAFYVVANDGDLHALDVKGDTLLVEARHPKNGARKSAEFVITGGKCECHINKLAGPEVITF